jgi:hypothetical protein
MGLLSLVSPKPALFAQAPAENSSIQVNIQANELKANHGSVLNVGTVKSGKLVNASVTTDIKADSIKADNGARVEVGTVTGPLINKKVDTTIVIDDINAKKDLSLGTVTVEPRGGAEQAKESEGQKIGTVTLENKAKATHISNTVAPASGLENLVVREREKKYEKTGGVSPGGTLYDSTGKKAVDDALRKGESAGNTTIESDSSVRRIRKATDTTGGH